MKQLNIFFLHNKTASRLYRILPQAKFLESRGHSVWVRDYSEEINKDILEWTDLAILQTVFVPKIFQLFKNAGAKTIFEVDDLMEWTSKYHPHHKDMTWKRVLMTWRAIQDRKSTRLNSS